MTTLFIKRPVLAITLNAFIILLGWIAYQQLNLSEYPEISVPKIKVGVIYPGASMHVVESNIAFDLEEELSGISKIDTIRSEIGNGYCETWLTFKSGAKIEQALIDVRDRVARVKSKWPKDVLEPYIDQEGKDNNNTLFLTLTSNELKPDELTHLARLHLKNQLQSIQGIASVRLNGIPYVMEIQLDRIKMAGYKVSVDQVLKALNDNQVSLASGKFQGTVPITLKLELENPEDFEAIVVRKTEDELVFLRDIATIGLSHNTKILNQLNGHNAVFLGLAKAPDGNPLSISKQVKALLPTFRANLPKNVQLQISFDGSRFIESSLKSLGWTLVEASILVLLVVFYFLRNLKATLVPLVTIPISLLGSLAIAKLFGFSLNTFSLLALVLAVGLVVDDAIVVLENIHRHLEDKLSPKDAAIKGSQEIAFAIVAMTITLAAVFMPIALSEGLVGQVLIQFGVTLAAAVFFSGIVALTLTPWMCSKLLSSHAEHNESQSWQLPVLEDYGRWILACAALVLIGTGFLYNVVPKRVVPVEDRGFVGIQIEPLPGATLETLTPYIDAVQKLAEKNPNIENRFLYSNSSWGTGFSFALKEHGKRSERSVNIADQLRQQLKAIPSITTHVWNWDTGLPGFEPDANGAGISVALRTTKSYQELSTELERIKKLLADNLVLKDVSYDLEFNFPGLRAKIDHTKMALLEVSVAQAASSMRVLFDQNESLEFYKDGLKYNIWLKGAEFSDNLHEIEVLNASGHSIPLSAFMTLEPTVEPRALTHYDRLRSATLSAQLAPGKNLSDGIVTLQQELGRNLSANYSYSFTGSAKNWLDSSGTFLWLLLLAMIFIYGILAIQFESFGDPLVILITVPLAAFGALLALWLSGQELNIFGQIGLVTLIGLISKHGILLVDFANQTGSIEKALRMRLRPILMTTCAMVLGALPLMLASGAGSEARRAIGTVLVSGLTFGTVLTLFVLPTFYRFLKVR